MAFKWPESLESVESLDEAIEQGLWPAVWSRESLGVNDDDAFLWFRLAREVRRTAGYVKDDESSENDTEYEDEGNYDTTGSHDESPLLEDREGENDASPNGEQTEDADRNTPKCPYSADERIARVLLGDGDPCEDEPKLNPKQQDVFEQSTFSEMRTPGEPQSTGRNARLIYIKLIEKGRAQKLWDLCVPSYPVLIYRPIPRNQISNLDRLHEAREVREALLSAIKDSPQWLEEHRLGTILLSAMLWDGLLEKEGVEALAHSISSPLVRGPAGFWLDLLLDPDKPARTRIRRFWPKPLTTMLWLRYENNEEDGVTPEQAVTRLVTRLLNRKAPSVSNLMKGIAQEISLELPEVLVNVATGQILTHPIKAGRWHGIQKISLPGINVPELSGVSDENGLEYKDGNRDTKSDERNSDEPLLELVNPPGMTELRRSLREKSVKGMVRSLEQMLKNEANQPPIINYLALWLKKPSTHASASTRNWMFGLVGARLVSLCGWDDLKLYDDDELEHVYTLVIEDGRSTSLRRGMRYSLMSFHRYLSQGEHRKRLSLLSESERSEVSSRVITHDEYHEALELLGRPGPKDDDLLWLEACQIALILFYRLGMRRRELLWLPLHDIHGNNFIEIIIRPFSERSLKTSNALRSLTLNGFLSGEELTLVKKWLRRRRNEATVNQEDFYFFSLTNSEHERIPEAKVVERLVEVLRHVTGDSNIHIHHLRHSFASWFLMGVLGEVIEEDFAKWSHLPKTQQWLREFPAVINSYHHKDPPQRSLLYLTASLMGHSTPAITLEHYIHITDYLLGSALGTAMSISPVQVGEKGMGLTKRTFQRWVLGGWSGVIEQFARGYPERWSEGASKRQTERSKVVCAPNSLYERYYLMWQSLKWDEKGLALDSPNPYEGEVDDDDLRQAKIRSANLKNRGLITGSCPSFPHGKRRETLTKEYVRIFEDAMQNEQGQYAIKKICEYWTHNKIKGRGTLRFRDAKTAKEYIDSLLLVGIPWSALNFIWVGSRFTQREAKENRARWRKAMVLSKRVTIGIKSIHNDRPLAKSGGYMDIRVVSMQGSPKLDMSRSSIEFQWAVIMLMICGDV